MATSQSSVKRKEENNEYLANKNLKIEDSNDEELPYSGSSSDSSMSSSQNSTLTTQGGANVQIPFSLQITSPKKNILQLKLTTGTVLQQFLTAFSAENLPTSITYNGDKHNLTPAFEEFWENLCNSSKYTYGNKVKLIHKNVYELLRPIAKVLRRGWEDQRYFPVKLAQPFLEACLFNRENSNDILFTSQTFIDFIGQSEGNIIRNYIKTTVNDECLEKVFDKYIPNNRITVRDKVEDACKEALKYIMFTETEIVRKVWTDELVGLLDIQEFKFLLKKQPMNNQNSTQDMDGNEPHTFWKSFFYGWDRDKVEFYFDLISDRSYIKSKCQYCLKINSGPKELVIPNCCSMKLRTKMKERNDCALKIIVKELKNAIETQRCYFSTGNPWHLRVMYSNYSAPWTEDLEFLNDLEVKSFPDIVVYSTSPKKRALVIEVTVSYEYHIYGRNLHDPEYDKDKRYQAFIYSLRKNGFDTEYHGIKIGSRGGFSYDLYKLCEEVFGLKHGDISRVLEHTSRKIIDFTYDFYCPIE